VISAKSVWNELKVCGVTHIVGLADNASAALVALPSGDDCARFIGVTREGEAFGLASGLWIGGKTAVVVIQNTGFLESGDGFRGTAQRMRIPLVCLITYRGYEGLRRQRSEPGSRPWTIEDFSRADLDSAAIVMEPTLKAWNVPYDFLETNADLVKIGQAFSRAEKELRPVALLVTTAMT
jgi:hypothetical protein